MNITGKKVTHTSCSFLLTLLLVGYCQGFISPSGRSILKRWADNVQINSYHLAHRRLRLFSKTGELDTEVKLVEDGASSLDTLPRQGKVNEIDFCMAPSDVSLSSSGTYTLYSQSQNNAYTNDATGSSEPKQILSLTRALNNASNRALRRILLSRAWPSPEALNRSLRQVLAAENERSIPSNSGDSNEPKCPIPRPVLNILMGRQKKKNDIPGSGDIIKTESPRKGRTDEEWVSDQIQAFARTYGKLPGYPLAEAYLESILSLATSGVESPKVTEVLAGGVYSESYRRFINVLKSVGVQFVEVLDSNPPLTRIAPDLSDFDICLSIMDKINMQKEQQIAPEQPESLTERDNSSLTEKDPPVSESKNQVKASKRQRVLKFFSKGETDESDEEGNNISGKREKQEDFLESNGDKDLGGVLLSSKEPTMTRQLNVLSNIVKRALLFGGDQELLVLFETLEADKDAFIQRWYPGSNCPGNVLDEVRPGVQYFNNLVQLLKNCYKQRVVSDLEPPLPLSASYANSYERLVASLVELGSGYINPWSLNRILGVLPKTPTEELGRFAKWESSLRKTKPDTNAYPEDLVGKWQVEDEVGGKTIGVSIVEFAAEGNVNVSPPLQGLRWRLDPGPTHLDTCTFQVVSEDGTILQYRGFLDRGARIESRFSKRTIKIRGSVTFQMRDGEALILGDDYRKDMLPVSLKTATTRFIMKRVSSTVDDFKK